jgi:hypothetical protein
MRDIRIYLLMLLAFLALGAQALPQDDEPTAEDETATEEADANADVSADSDDEELVIDSESYADIEEEDFRPTEEIDADQSIPFPTDI